MGIEKPDVKHLLSSFEDEEKTAGIFRRHFEVRLNGFLSAFESAEKEFNDLIRHCEENGIRQPWVQMYLYSSLHHLYLSTKLLTAGMLVPSGNLIRSAIESLAIALLCSNPVTGIQEKIEKNEFLAVNGMTELEKHQNCLDLNPDGVAYLKEARTFYNKFSHASNLNLAAQISFESKGNLTVFGAHFDNGKLTAYEDEIKRRTSFAKLVENVIEKLISKEIK